MVINDLVSSIPIVVGKIAISSSARTLILAAGGSCSGKTYFSKQLQAALAEAGISSALIEQDSYFRDFNDPMIPRDRKSRILFDHPGSYHNDQLRADISALLAGRSIDVPVYDILTNTRTQKVNVLSPCRVVIVEGLFAISEAEVICEDTIRVFVDASLERRIERRVDRDKQYGVDEHLIRSAFPLMVEIYHQQFVLPQKSKADIIIQNEWR